MVESFLKQLLTDFQPYHVDKGMTYEDGLILSAAQRFFQLTGDPTYFAFLEKYMDAHIDSQGNILGYVLEDFNIDNILAGNTLFFMLDQTQNPKYAHALSTLRKQLENHPRTQSLSFWHKKRYPNQVWLDGLYMGQVFYLRYSQYFGENGILTDVMNQVENVRKFLWDDAKKLYVHAYDETRKMQWADKTTGHSPNVWSRSVGWWAMALADLAELAEQTDEKAKHRLGQLLEETIKGMLPFRDAQYHMWFQLVEKPDITGNYLETSGSSMMVYSMIKGVRLGLLDPSYLAKALETLQGIEKRYLSEKDGKFYLGGTCSVAGLDNERRNGSVEYYLSEKIAVNEIKGIAPYLFCYAEWMLLKKQKTTN